MLTVCSPWIQACHGDKSYRVTIMQYMAVYKVSMLTKLSAYSMKQGSVSPWRQCIDGYGVGEWLLGMQCYHGSCGVYTD